MSHQLETRPRSRQWIRRRLREGPTGSRHSEAGWGWRWYHVVWCFLLLSWFGTTGRPVDLLVAGSLIVVWVFGPAIGVFIGGNLAVLGLQLLPTVGWALPATELILAIPVLTELWVGSKAPRIRSLASVTVLLVLAVATAGVWGRWPVTHIVSIVAGCYLVGIVWLHVRFRTDSVNTNTQQDGSPNEETS